MEISHGFVHTNGIRMHYAEQGEGPLVLLCHGWPESSYSWRNQLPALAAAGFRTVAPDQRGYGLTDAPAEIEAYNILELCGDLVGLVGALGADDALLIGHDWGAIVAATAALLRPDMFHALGLLSVPYIPRQKLRPRVSFDLTTQERNFYQHYFQEYGKAERELEDDLRRSITGILYTASGAARTESASSSFIMFDKNATLVDNLVVPTSLPAWLTQADVDQYVTDFERSGFRGPLNWYRNLDRNWALTPFLDGAKILQPTIFVAGALDGVLQMASAEYNALETNCPKLVGKHVIEGVGHWTQQEGPEQVNALLIDFLKGQLAANVRNVA